MANSKNHKDSKSNKSAIKALEKENQQLRREIARLDSIVSEETVTNAKQHSQNTDSYDKLLDQRLFDASLVTVPSYPRYIRKKFSISSAPGNIAKAFSIFRKFRFLSVIVRFIYSALAIIGTGAFFIFLSGIMLFFVPFLVLFGTSIYIASTFFRKKDLEKLSATVKNKKLYVLFPPKERAFEKESFFYKSIENFSKIAKDNSYMIIISPFFCSSKGFGRKDYYPILRFEHQNVCLVRKYAFFAMKRRILGPMSKNVTYVH